MRIAIMGAGAMGTTLGAHLAQKGLAVELIDTYLAHINALNDHGAKIVGCTDLLVPVHALLPEDMEGKYDLVFLTVKQTNNEKSLQQLLPHLNPDSTVCTLQNGLPEPAVARFVGEDRTVGAACRWGATFLSPGIVELTQDLSKRTVLFELGEMKGGITERIKMVGRVLDNMGYAEIQENLMGARWTKLMLNCSMSGLSAALGCTFGEVLDNDKALTCLSYLAGEVVHVAEACGAHLTEANGLKPSEIANFSTQEELERSKGYLCRNYAPLRTAKASMLQDLEKGTQTEVRMINGYTCEEGRRHGIPTPFNDKVVELVQRAERGEHPVQFSNLDNFSIPTFGTKGGK